MWGACLSLLTACCSRSWRDQLNDTVLVLARIIHERRLVVDKIEQFQEVDAQVRFLRAFHNLIQERVWNQRFKPESARLMNNPG